MGAHAGKNGLGSWAGGPAWGPVFAGLLLATLFVVAALPAQAQRKPKAAPASDKTEEPAAEPDASSGRESRATVAPEKASGPKVVEVEEGDEGVKTYKFGPVEVEGRLKSPQILYFLRRVRAEFEAGLLGHRSFMRELSDTRRHPSFK
jgi:hypothetical protein